MKSWYQIQAKAAGAAEILIYDEIGLFGITAKKFIDDLKALGNLAHVILGVNSPGGDVFEGIAVYNALKRNPAKVTARVDGIAASIASLITMAGDTIQMAENSMLMIHNPWGGAIGEADDMREMADALDKIKLSMLTAYRRSGKSDEDLSAIMDAETWYTAEEAKAAGFADEVLPSVAIAAFFDLKKFQKAPEHLREKAHQVHNKTPCASDAQGVSSFVRSAAVAQQPAAQVIPPADPEPTPAPTSTALEDQLHTLRPEAAAAEYTSRVLKLCELAGVPDMAVGFIETQMTIAAVEERLKDAQRIRAICVASRLPDPLVRASSFIRAGVTLVEARDQVLKVLHALQSPEIDNKFSPDADGNGVTRRGRTSSSAEIYRQRSSRNTGAAELGRKLAKVIQEHVR